MRIKLSETKPASIFDAMQRNALHIILPQCARPLFSSVETRSKEIAHPALAGPDAASKLQSSQKTRQQRDGLMLKGSAAVSFAYKLGSGLSAVMAPSVHSLAHAQSADLLLCDRVATDPPIRTSRRKSKARQTRPVRCRNGDQILQARVGDIAPGALPARS